MMFDTIASGVPRIRINPPTLIGISAVLMWSGTIGFYRNIAETFGPVGGAALIFTVSGLIASLHGGRASFQGHSLRYILIGGSMFVAYEVALALAVGFAQTRSQSMEVGLINYLWPCFTIALAVWVGDARANFLLIPGILLCLCGVTWASSGDQGFSLIRMCQNIMANPLPYLMALVAAIFWPVYTITTRTMSKGRSAVAPFLLATSVVLWIYYLSSDEPALHFNLKGALMVVTFGILTTLAYSAWTYGVNHGDLTLLATASYFTPLLSVLISCLLLNMMPSAGFWTGSVLVTGGSLLCYWASRHR